MLRAGIGYALAEALIAAGQKELAVVEARAALAVFRTLGARPDADRTGALLSRLGAPTRSVSRGEAPEAAVHGLTSREREVLALVCEGLTNAQIGQRLYVTTKTAEHHVGRVLAKLGVSSRAQAMALVHAGEP